MKEYDTGDLMVCFIDFGEVTLPKHIWKFEDIILYFFADGFILTGVIVCFHLPNNLFINLKKY